MATKKSKSTSSKNDKATKQLRSDLASAKAKRDDWKKRAVRAEAAVADLRARLKVAEKSLKKATKASAGRATTEAAAPAEQPAASPEAVVSPEAVGGPDDGWTVAQLRAEARRRGLTGLSNKPKAELLAALA